MSLNFEQLEANKIYRNLYAPFARVKVEGKDLLKHGLEITSVTVDLSLKGMDQFTFVVNNVFDIVKREFNTLKDPDRNFISDIKDSSRLDNFLDFGQRVEIFMGYLDKTAVNGRDVPMFTGLITSVRTSFPSGGFPQLTVSGYDLSYRMTKGIQSRSWHKKKDSEIVTRIASENELAPQVKDTKVKQPRIDQSQETDYQFLTRLANRNKFELYVRNKELYFKPPFKLPRWFRGDILALDWGKSLLSFTPEINLAEQITKVEVAHWNVNTKKEIIGKAEIGDELGIEDVLKGVLSGKRLSGGAHLKKIFKQGKQPVHRIRLPVYTQEHADREAKALLTKFSEEFLTGSGESIGIPEIRPDTFIALGNLGEKFSKPYYVEKATHTVNSSGYKTTFNVKETVI